MKFLKNILDFYIQSSLHIAFAVFALVRITEISLQLSSDTTLELTIFFGTIVGYNFLKYFEAFQKGNFDLNRNRYLVGLTFLSVIATLFYFLQLTNSLQIYFIKIGLLVALYPILRKFGFWKLFLVGFCVTAITVYAPIIQQNAFSDDEKIILLQRFFIIFSLMIPFEILDSQTDDDLMKTLPQRFGIFKTKLFGIVLLFPFVLLEFFNDKIEILNFAAAIITALFIGFTTFKRDKYYASFWVESVPILWLVLLLIFS
ncbi:MAG TPA: hypothetical protein PLL09_10545 [Flavobacterium sp.]|uniref:hypothetical protein n=1 Tax=unclassified Flavobacterium TaxID=196869 RepID=UPI0025B87920|nr:MULTISPECIES: hypothetical protein [unclassified Flavobacterium]HRE78248.1 hypothetical protein [Flavobacterium sp.]